MSKLDIRTRTGAAVATQNAAQFFETELPRLLADRFPLVEHSLESWPPQSLTIRTGSGAWTISTDAPAITVAAGDSGQTQIQLNEADFSDYLNDLTTIEMLFNLGRVSLERGDRRSVSIWEVALRSLIDNVPMATTSTIPMQDRSGVPLDLTRSFSPDDDPSEMAHFLAEAGFLHLSGWLDADLMHEIAQDMEDAFATATKTDGSWWVSLADGSETPARVLGFADRSAATRLLLEGEVMARVLGLTDDGYAPTGNVEALQKPKAVVSGISDIPWHRDCDGGLHSYLCHSLTIGIQVTGAGPGSAQLGVIPGSHRARMPNVRYLPNLGGAEPSFLTTATGDITIHASCLFHTALPPTEYERKVIYAAYALPREAVLQSLLDDLAARRQDVGATAVMS